MRGSARGGLQETATRFERRRPGVAGGAHGNVNVFEDLAGRDALQAVGRFDEIVAWASGVLAAERVGEDERCVELFGFNQEAGAVNLPVTGGTTHCVDPRGGGVRAASYAPRASNLRL